MSFLYILKNDKGKYYVGSTVNIERRFKQHLSGHTHSTARLGILQLVFKQKYDTLKDARYIEKRIKNLKRRDYIEQIVKDGLIKIKPR